MSQKTDPILARVNASPSQNLIEVTDVGQGLVWALNEENASWFRGVGAPTSFLGQLPGNLYLDTASGNIWQLNSGGVWVEIGNVEPISNVANAGFRDDFMSGNFDAQVSTAVDAQFDTLWAISQISAAGRATMAAGSFQHPGQLALETGSSSGYGIILNKNLTADPTGYLGSNAGWEADIILELTQTTDICIRAGFSNALGVGNDPPTEGGIFLRYDTAAGDTYFTWETATSSASTTSTANSILADTNFHHFRIRSLVAGTILFSVDGGTETALSTHVPTDDVSAFVQVLARSSSGVSLFLDFFSYTAQTGRT